MADISTDRLGPTAPTIAPTGRQNRDDANSRPSRRPVPRPKPQDQESDVPDDSSGSPHQVDQMA